MKNIFNKPNWEPMVSDNKKILITGATGGIGRTLVRTLLEGSNCIVGAHGNENRVNWGDDRVIPIYKDFDGEKSCLDVITEFCRKAGGLDAIVILSGSIRYSGHWKDIPEESWNREIRDNLYVPFFLARTSMLEMIKTHTGGKIILTGTESSLHGGSAVSLPYAIAKRGTECLVQGLAREGAPYNILVNGVRMGYIESGFHQRWHRRTQEDMEKRATLVPLRRGGHPEEVATMIAYMLSDYGDFITGQMIPLTGGDWL